MTTIISVKCLCGEKWDRVFLKMQKKGKHRIHLETRVGIVAIRLIFGPDSDSYKNPPKNKADSPRIPDSLFRISDSSNILKGA